MEQPDPSQWIDLAFGKPVSGEAFWQVDLPLPYPIQRIVLSENDLGAERTVFPVVETSNDGEDWGILAGEARTTNVPRRLEFNFPEQKARYIRLRGEGFDSKFTGKVEILSGVKVVEECENVKRTLNILLKKPLDRNIRVAVLGTSNSVMRPGYVTALKSCGFDLVANASLGSSHATVVPFRMLELEPLEFDVLILDLSVNEQRAVKRGIYNLEYSKEIFEYYLAKCAEKNALPLLLLMPEKFSFDLPDAPFALKVANHYMALCRERGVPFFNGYQFTQLVAEKWQRPVPTLFKNSNHLNLVFAQILGSHLASEIVDYLGQAKLEKTRTLQHDYTYLSIPEHCPAEKLILRETKLATQQFALMREGDSLRLPCPKAGSVIGVVLNMSQTNGALKIANGKDFIIKRLDSAYMELSKPLLLVSWMILRPLNLTEDVLEITCQRSIADKDCQRSDLSRSETPNYEELAPVIEVAGLIVRLPKVESESARVSGMDLDLMAHVEFMKLTPA